MLGNAGELFSREDLWDRWSRGLSFAMKMSEGPDARESQLSICCNSEEGQARDHVKNVEMNVSGSLNRDIDSLKAIGSCDVGGVGEESNVM